VPCWPKFRRRIIPIKRRAPKGHQERFDHFIQPAVLLTFSLAHLRVEKSRRRRAKGGSLEMWGGIIGLIIQLISGAIGGNIAGAAMKQYNLGTIGNSIAGLIGGGVGAQIIGALLGGGGEGAAATGGSGLDIGSIIGQIASGGVGGGILMVIVGLIKQAMGGQKAT
jgi:hypothetical protein